MPPNDQNPIFNVPKKPLAEAVPQDAPTIMVPASHVVFDFVPKEPLTPPPPPVAPPIPTLPPTPISTPTPPTTPTPPPALSAFAPMSHTTMTPSLVPPPQVAPATPASPPMSPVLAALDGPSSSFPSALPSTTFTPTSSLSRAEQVAMFTKDLDAIKARKESMRTEIATLSVEQKKEESLLAPLFKKENDFQAEYEAIEKKEASAIIPADKRKFEQERFELETKRQALLAEKFAAMEKSEKIKESIAQKEAIYQSVVTEETQLKVHVHELEVEAERKVLHDELQGVVKSRGEAEVKLGATTKEKTNAELLLNEIIAKEKGLEESAHATGEAMSTATSLQEQRSLAETRAKLETERHLTEEARWKAEDSMSTININEAEATKALEAIKAHEAELFAKLQTIK